MVKRDIIYDTYWRTAAERQEIFYKKINALSGPLTDDQIFREYKFCNVYRASDRESQFLIRNVIYGAKKYDEKDVIFRVLLYRLLNRSKTWKILEEEFGEISSKTFIFKKYSRSLSDIKKNQPIYGNAFILCANKIFGYDKKHDNHLALMETIINDSSFLKRILNSKTLKFLYETLLSLPLIGSFMAYQMAIDLNYSEIFNFDENDFTKAGPGAIRGIKKCFASTGGLTPEEVIMYMVREQNKEFDRLGLKFRNLYGREMKAIDCQNWFCETDKYCRVSHPEIKSNREKIKSIYRPGRENIDFFYPPKWGLKL